MLDSEVQSANFSNHRSLVQSCGFSLAPVTRVEHHPFDRFYNFFSRRAWTVESLAHQVAVAIVLALNPTGPLYLVVDDTLLHKRGQRLYGLAGSATRSPPPPSESPRPRGTTGWSWGCDHPNRRQVGRSLGGLAVILTLMPGS